MSNKCKICKKSVYPMDPQINLDGSIFHKTCAKCADCSCQITLSNFTKNENDGVVTLLCKTHYFKRFHEQGSYLGGDKFQVKNPRDEKSGPAPSPSAGAAAPLSPAPSSAAESTEGVYSGVKLKSTPKKDAEPTQTVFDSLTAEVAAVSVQEAEPQAVVESTSEPAAEPEVEPQAEAEAEPDANAEA